MNQNKIAEICKLIEQSRSSGKHPHYSNEVKDLAKSLLKDGVSRAELTSATGISRVTLINWTEARKSNFRKLKAVSTQERPGTKIKVTLASGISIEVPDASLLKAVLEQCV